MRGTAADFRPERGALFDLSTRTKLRIIGADRLRYLNGQITNDLRKATEDHAIYACVLTAKGKVSGDVFIRTEGDSFVIDADPALRDPLPARLERYLIADEVQMEDVTDEFALFHLTGADLPPLPAGSRAVAATRFACPGMDIWLPASQRAAALQEFSARWSVCGQDCAEALRIERGLPAWGRELTEEIIPTEANLEASAIDYAKGCYIGQEVISRIKMSGQTNKRLCGLVVEAGSLIAPGMRLIAEDGKDVGWITSATTSARLGQAIALGFLKRGYQEVGTQLVARSADGAGVEILVRVAELPFA